MDRLPNRTRRATTSSARARAIAVSRFEAGSNINRLIVAGCIGLLALFMVATFGAQAEETDGRLTVPPEMIETMQTVIRGQIDAFQADDAETAFSYAAPGIQQRFANPARFVAMVRQSYATVFEHQSFSFIDEALTPEGPAQRVEFVSEDGQVWGGIYTFEQSEDGELYISGVLLRRENARQI